jgi:uncharacterized protein (DUF58 family)
MKRDAEAGGTSRQSLDTAGPLFDLLRGSRWPARRPAGMGAPGAHRSRRRGTALEFTEYRPYRQGDDPRRLDWRLLARTDRAYVRVTDDHALMPTSLVVDGSASMAFPQASLAKWRSAQLIALGLAFVAHSEGDPVALGVVGDRTARCPLRTRRGVLADLASTLDSVTPAGPGGLAPMIGELGGSRRGRMVIVSDYLDDASDVLAQARRRTADGTMCYAVHVVAREELSPPERTVLVSDPENSAIRRPLTRATRAAYLANFAEWRAALRQAWQAAGASYILAITDEPVDRIIRRILRPIEGQA